MKKMYRFQHPVIFTSMIRLNPQNSKCHIDELLKMKGNSSVEGRTCSVQTHVGMKRTGCLGKIGNHCWQGWPKPSRNHMICVDILRHALTVYMHITIIVPWVCICHMYIHIVYTMGVRPCVTAKLPVLRPWFWNLILLNLAAASCYFIASLGGRVRCKHPFIGRCKM